MSFVFRPVFIVHAANYFFALTHVQKKFSELGTCNGGSFCVFADADMFGVHVAPAMNVVPHEEDFDFV